MARLTRNELVNLWNEATEGQVLVGQALIDSTLEGAESESKKVITAYLTNVIDDIRRLKLAIEETQ